MALEFEKRTLSNGLDVIVHEDHQLPLVAVSLWYHVGSKNERPGRTGFAHLFEHLMFEGSAHHDRGFFPPLQEAGASLNGSTNADRTNYWELVPAQALDLALWMESDRMGWLLPALTQQKFDNQRDVVLNERRQNYENRPYGLAQIVLARALYAEGHPYSWPTIGEVDDLRAAMLDEVRDFFARYYHPANASLVLAGDITPEQGVAAAQRYFGDIPPGPAVEQPSPAPAQLASDARLVLEDRVEFPRVYFAWHSPRLVARDDAELDLAADVLANGKTSRLYRLLVRDRRIALDVAAYQSSRELCGVFQVVATAATADGLPLIERAVRDELMRLAAEGPAADEMERAMAQAEAHFVYRLQSIGGFNGRSDQLNAYNVFLGEPGYFDRDLARYRDTTRESVRSAVARWLVRAPSVALSVIPEGRRDLALPGSAQAEAQ
jgi:zinc protease